MSITKGSILRGGITSGGILRSQQGKAYFFDIISTQTIAGVFQTTAPITVYWGDGTSNTYNGTTDQAYSKNYGSVGSRIVTVVGESNITNWTMTTTVANVQCDLADLPVNLTYFSCIGANTITGDLADLPVNLTYFSCAGDNTITGDIADLPVNLTYFRCEGLNTVNGDLGDLPVNLTYFRCYGLNTVNGDLGDLPVNLTYFTCVGSNTVNGDLGDLPVNLTYFYCVGSNTVNGDLGDLPVNLTYFYCAGSNAIFAYTSKTWAKKPTTFILTPVSPGGLDATEINNLLIDFDEDLTWTSGDVITLTGTNAAPTGPGITAKNNMIAEGAIVTTT